MRKNVFDVYLGYNECNFPEAYVIYKALKEQGINPWFDKEDARPGSYRADEMLNGLRRSKAIILLIGSAGIDGWHGEQIQNGLILSMATRQRRQKPLIPVKLASFSLKQKLPPFLNSRVYIDLMPRLDEHNFKRLIYGITDKKPATITLKHSVFDILHMSCSKGGVGFEQASTSLYHFHLAQSDAQALSIITRVCSLLERQQFVELGELINKELAQHNDFSQFAHSLHGLTRELEGAKRSGAAYFAEEHLHAAEKLLQTIKDQYAHPIKPLAIDFTVVLHSATEALIVMQAANSAATTAWLPNPFVAGNPLSAAQCWGKKLLRGREKQVRELGRRISNTYSANPLALLGPRSHGKSSLINMLRGELPGTQLILFDLYLNPADSPLAFYRALVRQAQRQAEEDRRLQLPDLPEGSPIEALAAWLDLLERDQRVTRFLICIDEFERLPDLFPASADGSVNRDLLQFLGLLRATVQHRQRVRLLVAGAAPFDELETLWTDHLINLQEIQVGFLDAASAEGLLTQPCPEMPTDAIPAALARAMVARTAGQPYLTQLYGQILIDQLNDAERRQACLDDLEPVEREALSKAVNYFQNIWRALRPDAAQALLTLAQGQPLALPSATRRYLQRRLLIGEDDRLLIPVFQRWLLEFQLDAAG